MRRPAHQRRPRAGHLAHEHPAQPVHRHAQAVAAVVLVPVQEARLSTISQTPNSLQFTLQNLAIALYAKMGGTPWKVDQGYVNWWRLTPTLSG